MTHIIDTKWKEFKAKSINYEIDKISLSCFDDKRYALDDGIHTPAYFHKDRVTSCKTKIKTIMIKKKGLKKIVIKKDWKRLQKD